MNHVRNRGRTQVKTEKRKRTRPISYVAKSPKETVDIARLFLDKLLDNAKKSSDALVVGLSGDLGAGKTTFVQTVAKHLGIKSKISSPTFVIIKKHKIKNKITSKKYKFMFHLDAYRLKNEKELLALGWEEIIENPEHIVFVEWPKNVKKAMPKTARFIRISHAKKENERVLYLQ
ncbi:tRNA (adenosine(37)-N6)-threonylcarbamoyltransferase complex ATPase subunit type 1 TsaE [Candidatus Nomurabacteria bacterium]|nr:tRNA (adenosine(37)-N6)-threonylcarbamoyltransferase complex ATPase subunit type 1 TsaE [Candidatus Nomurabacteria bacterium]